MENQRIIFTRPDNTVGVVIPAPDYTGTMEELAASTVPDGLVWKIVAAAALPLLAGNLPQRQRTYRNAWRAVGQGVTVDMAAARSIHATNIARKAAVAGATVNMPNLASASTQEELYEIWPAEIEKRVKA